ncbi:alpha/beta hydrolase [Candidatus Saccharibacteria bacterium]|nr:alpha/beta hydrolase [Candidatus Saccharibacteria bacterium]
MTVIVDGIATNYVQEGSGPTVVLLHGWGDSLKTFDGLAKSLKRNYTVVRLDLPGFGGSDAPKETFSLSKYAAFTADFLNKIGQEHIYAYLGHSNGGAVCIKGLASGVLCSDKLVLIASAGIRSDYQGKKKVLRLAAKAAKLPTNLLPKQTQNKLKKRVYGAIGSDLFVAEHLQDTFKKVVSEDVVAEAAMIAQPTLILYGKQDTATPPNYGERYAHQIEKSNLIILDCAGHFVHHDASTKVHTAIEEFLV